jgi:hypothetical protein
MSHLTQSRSGAEADAFRPRAGADIVYDVRGPLPTGQPEAFARNLRDILKAES